MKPLRRIINFACCCLLLFSIASSPLASNRAIKVGIYQNKPKVFIDSQGKPQGFFIDILEYIGTKEGWQIEYIESTWKKHLENLETGEIDLLLDIADSIERARHFDFNKEIVFSNWAIIYLQKNSTIQSILDLRGKKIAAMKGDISYKGFHRTLEGLGIYCDFVEVDEFSDVFNLVSQKKADAGIMSRLFGLQNEIAYDVRRSTIICCPNNLYFAVPKNKNHDLLEIIDQHLYELKRKEDSIYYKSLVKWIEGIAPRKWPAWLKWIVIMGGMLVVLLLVGISALKIQVASRTAELKRKNEELSTTQTYLLLNLAQMRAEIADRKRAEDEKANLQKQLIQAQKMEAIGALAGGIAHDFNNILQVITGYAQMMRSEIDGGDQDSDISTKIIGCVSRAAKLTRQLLTFSRKIESRLRPINLNREISKIQNMLESTIPKMVAIELKLENRLEIINADPGQIEQVLLNLALNASHAMSGEGKLTIQTRNIIFDENHRKSHFEVLLGRYVLLNITDTGCGIDRGIQDRIFEPFFTTKEPGEGTGLGLSAVYGIVKNHHGHIVCESEPGQGTSFKIYFPALINKDANVTEAQISEAQSPGGHETILFIDDEETILDISKKMLQQLGYTVITAAEAEQALEMYKADQKRIDLVIIDLNMPRVRGRMCLTKLLEIDPSLKFIVVSGYSSFQTVAPDHNTRACAFIEKPFQLDELSKKIREVLDKDH